MPEISVVPIRALTLLKFLCIAIAVLTVLHLLTYVVGLKGSLGPLTGFFNNYGRFFDLNQEQNIPTWFSVIQLALLAQCAALAGAMDRGIGRPALAWFLLSGLFAYLSLDEATDLHGLLRDLTPEVTLGDQASGFDWVVPGAVLVVVVALAFLPWLLRLPARTRNLLILSGAIFVGGGLGMETLGAYVADATFMNPAYIIASTLEEVMEMLGIALAITTTLLHLEGRTVSARFVA